MSSGLSSVTTLALTRRDFLRVSVAVGGGLLVGLGSAAETGEPMGSSGGQLGYFVRIDPDGSVTLGAPIRTWGRAFAPRFPC